LLCCAMCYLLVYCDLYLDFHSFTCALLSPGTPTCSMTLQICLRKWKKWTICVTFHI
jgi:hypothetical protein